MVMAFVVKVFTRLCLHGASGKGLVQAQPGDAATAQVFHETRSAQGRFGEKHVRLGDRIGHEQRAAERR